MVKFKIFLLVVMVLFVTSLYSVVGEECDGLLLVGGECVSSNGELGDFCLDDPNCVVGLICNNQICNEPNDVFGLNEENFAPTIEVTSPGVQSTYVLGEPVIVDLAITDQNSENVVVTIQFDASVAEGTITQNINTGNTNVVQATYSYNEPGLKGILVNVNDGENEASDIFFVNIVDQNAPSNVNNEVPFGIINLISPQILYYPFTSDATDFTAYRNDGTRGGTASFINGALLLYGGNEGYVVKENINHFPTNRFTISFWMKSEELGNTLFSYAYDVLNILNFKNTDTSRNVKLSINGQETDNLRLIRLFDNEWHHIVITWDGSQQWVDDNQVELFDSDGITITSGDNYIIYTDGLEDATGMLSPGTSLTLGGTFILGQSQRREYRRYGPDFEQGSGFKGEIDDFQIHTVVKDPETILQWFNEGRVPLELEAETCTPFDEINHNLANNLLFFSLKEIGLQGLNQMAWTLFDDVC
jgi:hypothetical protein